MFAHLFFISYTLYFFLWIKVSVWCHFLLAWKAFFSISCKAGLLEMNYLSFYLCMTVFVSPSFLKGCFTLLTDFFLSQLWICHFSAFQLAFIVSDEKSAINQIVPWCVMSHFSLAAFKIFSFLLLAAWVCYI